MKTEVSSRKLGDVTWKVGSGATPRGGKEAYLDEGPYSLIRSQNVLNSGFSQRGLVHINDEQADQLRNVEVSEGDVLLNITGDSVARACQVDPDVLPARVNQHVAIIRPDPAHLDPRYLRYWLVSIPIQQTLHGLASAGATRNALTKSMILDLEIDLPPIERQRYIAHVLGALDDKIEVNRRMSETLEEIARALFKSWFVDFDPVRAKAEGRDTGLPPHIADIFPDRLVESELGPIPDGWPVEAFDAQIDVLGGGTPKTSVPTYWGGEVPWFSVVDTPPGSTLWVHETAKTLTDAGAVATAGKWAEVGSTILSARGTVGNLALVGKPMKFNQSCYGLAARDGNDYFTFFLTQTQVERLRQRSHGSVFSTITRGTLSSLLVAMAPEQLRNVYDHSVAPMLERMRTLALESRSLFATRNTLLRELIG